MKNSEISDFDLKETIMAYFFVFKRFSHNLQGEVKKDLHVFGRANVCELYSTQIQKYQDLFTEIDKFSFQKHF